MNYTKKHTYLRKHPHLAGVRLTPHDAFPAGSLSPAQILAAYGFQQNQYAGVQPVKLGIGSLGGGVVQADIDASVAAWGLAAPNLTVRTVGGAVNDPVSDQDSNVENMLDLIPTMAFAWWWLTGTPADITICFGPNASNGMEQVTRDLVAAGVAVASWSWGSAADTWDAGERARLSTALAEAALKGVTFCAASGDNSLYDGTQSATPDYPASDPNVWGVGGTKIDLAQDGTISLESAWGDGAPGDEGGGGGFDVCVPMPLFQKGVVSLPAGIADARGVPDTSANADPASGWQMSANGSWTVTGGTSAASPFTAALIAVAKGVAALKAAQAGKPGAPVNVGLLTPTLYAARAKACRDITTGSDGDPAVAGWDESTGNGSPNGPAFIDAIVAALAA